MRMPVVCTVFALGAVACHGAPSYVGGGGLASARGGVPDTGSCNEIEQQGKEIDLVASSSPAPQALGGPIADGTYVLTRSTLHTKDAPPGRKLVTFGKITMVVKDGRSQLIRTDAEGHVRRSTVERASSGTITLATTLCASPGAGESSVASTEYTATSASVQLISRGPAGTVVASYTKVPETQASISRGREPEAGATAWDSASVMTNTLR